jgi:uncharacterized membrane protein YphA (DoxX/SURF4 family)
MAAHGAQKLFGWLGGGGITGTGQFFTMSGYPSGETMAVVAGLSELLGGLGIAAGLLTPLAGAAVVGTLVNALAVKWGGGFFAPQGVEYELLLAAAGAGIALTGPGRYAVDRFLPVLGPTGWRTEQPLWRSGFCSRCPSCSCASDTAACGDRLMGPLRQEWPGPDPADRGVHGHRVSGTPCAT